MKNFIMLTALNGNAIFINFNLVQSFCRYNGQDFTCVFYNEDSHERVKETIYQIEEILKKS